MDSYYFMKSLGTYRFRQQLDHLYEADVVANYFHRNSIRADKVIITVDDFEMARYPIGRFQLPQAERKYVEHITSRRAVLDDALYVFLDEPLVSSV